MYRLIEIPEPILLSRLTWLTGPNARSSGSNTAQDGSEQTFTGLGDVVSFRMEFSPSQDRLARRQRGFQTALMSGANAARFHFFDADELSFEEAGLPNELTPQPWANGERWTNGRKWAASYPVVPVAEPATYDSGILALADRFWGHMLGYGDYIGFFPFHFGLYMVTQVIEPGRYRIWPRLRKAITLDDFGTLYPTLVMKTMPGGTNYARGSVHTESQSVDLVEVIDPYIRQYFSD